MLRRGRNDDLERLGARGRTRLILSVLRHVVKLTEVTDVSEPQQERKTEVSSVRDGACPSFQPSPAQLNKEAHMTLIDHIYQQLRAQQLIPSAQAFSSIYVGKNPNWYSYQRHVGSDFSCAAAIQCLRCVRIQARIPQLSSDQQRVLVEVEAQLLDHLRAIYHVAEVI